MTVSIPTTLRTTFGADYLWCPVIVAALLRAVRDGNDIINLSLGGPSGWTESTISVVASRIAATGKTLAIAAGNDVRPFFPALFCPCAQNYVGFLGCLVRRKPRNCDQWGCGCKRGKVCHSFHDLSLAIHLSSFPLAPIFQCRRPLLVACHTTLFCTSPCSLCPSRPPCPSTLHPRT